MAEKNNDGKKTNRLVDAVRRSRVSSAERQDVVVDMKEADKARLELLAEKLRPVFDDIDQDDDRFEFTISSGVQPRVWIDSVAHVHMGRDRRTYRFVRDSRLGRVVLLESGDIDSIVEHVTNYIADRVIEREKLLEGDLETFKDYYRQMTNENLGADHVEVGSEDEEVAPKRQESPSAPFILGLTWFILGGLLGLALAFNYYEEILAFLQKS